MAPASATQGVGEWRLGVDLALSDMPNEIPNALPVSRDTAQRRYVPEHATSFWRVLLEVDRVFKEFRTGFVGKDSPVHLFWGSLHWP